MIIHFSPADTFSRKFLFHTALNQDKEGVRYFSIGKSGYSTDGGQTRAVLREYFQAVRLLVAGLGARNAQTVAYCHTTRYALPGLILCRLFGIGDVVYLNHGVPYIGHRGHMRWALWFIEKLNVGVAHRFVTVSPSMVPLLRSAPAPGSPWDCSTRPGSSSGLRGCDYVAPTQWKARAADKQRLGVRYLYAGRLQSRKGVFVLLDAWVRHIARFPDDELWLCGFDQSELETNSPFGNLKGIQAKGYVWDMKPVYDQVDVVVSPSFHEGFGYTLLEGAARGCCIVSSAVPGPDVLFSAWMRDLLFTAGDAENLARVMAHLSGSQAALTRGRLLSYRSALRFEMSRVSFPQARPDRFG